VAEVVSPSETRRTLDEKLADYCSVGVLECWLVHRKSQTIEVQRLTTAGPQPVATYAVGEQAQSLSFPGLGLAVADAFPS
jgi:Uma2 family endonuclease